MKIQLAVTSFKEGAIEAMEWFAAEAAKLRTGRVTTDIVSSVPVEHYGARTPLNGVASINMSDARTIVISPWDQTALSAIEKALSSAQIGAQPIVDGKIIRLAFPMLNEETREESVKSLHKKAEEARVRARRSRDEALAQLQGAKKDGDITEDDFFRGKKELDEVMGEFNKELDSIVEVKEKEIKTV
ncbi:MAG: ribosome recycling factor [Candidatus Andersenbacteria bacterium]|nr:ribosome recycling factor [bacterium]MDZ4225780.1 ribosome recycling factor [Candidatus Andersenbacteria bacterium]